MIAEQPEPKSTKFRVEYLVSGSKIFQRFTLRTCTTRLCVRLKIPDPGIYIITITLDHERFELAGRFGGTQMYMVEVPLDGRSETHVTCSHSPVGLSSNGAEDLLSLTWM